jgi:methyl-accepting chemotaxis protein
MPKKKTNSLEHEIQKVMPAFRVDKVVGSNIDMYHKNPAHQRRLLDDPKNLPHQAEIEIGPLKLDLNVSAVISESGEYVGNVVEWADVTAQKKGPK